jgi:SOS-response transcriptional repressor LexA
MYDGDAVQKRFEELKAQRRYKSARALIATSGLPRYTVEKILSGDIRDTSDQIHFRAILDSIGVTEDEFFGRPSRPKPQPGSDPSKKVSARQIPLYGEIPAGAPDLKDGVAEADEMIDAVPGLSSREHFALRVHGLSMSPHLLPGDIVYLERLDVHIGPKEKTRPAPKLLFERLHGRIVAALIDGESTLKVLHLTDKQDGDHDLHLLPMNESFSPLYINPDDDLRIQGVVVKMLRDMSTSVFHLMKNKGELSNVAK